MNIRAVVCDIYKTLLDVHSPPDDAASRWSKLCERAIPGVIAPSLEQFGAAAQDIIGREHAEARAAGIPYPEILWPAVSRKAWASLCTLDDRTLDDFLFEHAQLQRTVRLMPGSFEALRHLRNSGRLLGLASNSQPYTLRELDAALATGGMSRELFAPDLRFLSFEQGFSKPDPHVFRMITARLAAHDVGPNEILMVGDRYDNDIEPARAQNWRTWQLILGTPATGESGSWLDLSVWLDGIG